MPDYRVPYLLRQGCLELVCWDPRRLGTQGIFQATVVSLCKVAGQLRSGYVLPVTAQHKP